MIDAICTLDHVGNELRRLHPGSSATSILLHHTGWNQDRMRGSSSMLQAVDTVMQTEAKGENSGKIIFEKGKNAPKPAPQWFDKRVVELPEDTKGRARSSCVIEYVKDRDEKGRDARQTVIAKALEATPDKGADWRRLKQIYGLVPIEEQKAAFTKGSYRKVRKKVIESMVAAGHLEIHKGRGGTQYRLAEAVMFRDLDEQLERAHAETLVKASTAPDVLAPTAGDLEEVL